MYRHAGVAVLRAARAPIAARPDDWPDLTDDTNVDSWLAWLSRVWSSKDTVEAVALASPTLARRVEDVLARADGTVKDARRAVVSVIRYVLRETGRPTPFGLFAGVAPVKFGSTVNIRWGVRHRQAARVDTQWLADVVAGLESDPDLLERLSVTVTNLRSVRGSTVMLPNGPTTVEIRHTSAVRQVERIARTPIRFAALVEELAERFPTAGPGAARAMLGELVAQGFLVTCLRPPGTVTDPLRHLIDWLDEIQAAEVISVAPTLLALRAIRNDLDRHNHADHADRDTRVQVRASAMARMGDLSRAGRTPLAVDLRLDCAVTLPEQVAHEIETAAWALLRLTSRPNGPRAWRDYYAAFVQRYGVGAMVPLGELVDPGTGLGLPAGYPASLMTAPVPEVSSRDERLLALVHRAAADGNAEVVLDDETVAELAMADLDTVPIPPHVELSARVHATSAEALERGEFTMTVAPARAAGTMTGRFSSATPGLAPVYASLPTTDADAIPAQLSFPPVYPNAENVTRTPRFLPRVISLGEHRARGDEEVIPVDDLAVTADRYRLRLVWLSRHRPVEPQVFHALALDKQAPALARFLTALPRAHTACYTEFDWGIAARLSRLPRLRYRRCILSPARWRVDAADLTPPAARWAVWSAVLDEWRRRWRLPRLVELRDDDRVLRLDLDESAHRSILRAHLHRKGEAVLTEGSDDTGYGWLNGHAHEIAVPLVSTRPAPSSPLAAGRRPALVHAATHGHLPGSPLAEWVFAKLYVHPDRQREVIADHLPALVADLAEPRWWFVRYQSPHEPPHLRLRVRIGDTAQYGECSAVLGGWAQRLREHRLAQRLVLDTYFPELGRYGTGPTLAAAEHLFATDSHVVLTQLRLIPDTCAQPAALAAANLVDIACAFHGDTDAGMTWLMTHTADEHPAPIARSVLPQAIALADRRGDLAAVRGLPHGETLATQWTRRREALIIYGNLLPGTIDRDEVLASLLHMHHVRAVGIDRDHEKMCRRLARATALAWRARRDPR